MFFFQVLLMIAIYVSLKRKLSYFSTWNKWNENVKQKIDKIYSTKRNQLFEETKKKSQINIFIVYSSISFIYTHQFWNIITFFITEFTGYYFIRLQTLNPKAINFSTVSRRKNDVNTKFIKLNTSRSTSGASWNYILDFVFDFCF